MLIQLYEIREDIIDDDSNIVIEDSTMKNDFFYSLNDQYKIHRTHLFNRMTSDLNDIRFKSSEYNTVYDEHKVIYTSKLISWRRVHMLVLRIQNILLHHL